MSVQDPVAYPTAELGETAIKNGLWFKLAAGTAFCFFTVFAIVSGFANFGQVVAAIAVLSIGLSARAVLRLEEIEEHGLEEKPAIIESIAGIAIVWAMAGVALTATSSLFAPFDGAGQFVLFAMVSAGLFAAAVVVESVLSATTCIFLKLLLSKSAIGAEIAVMLNLQQKYQTQLA